MFEIRKNKIYYEKWPMSPKRINVLEYLLKNPNCNVIEIQFAIMSPQAQDIHTSLRFMAHTGGPHIVFNSDYGKWSILPEKIKEVEHLINVLKKEITEPRKTEE